MTFVFFFIALGLGVLAGFVLPSSKVGTHFGNSEKQLTAAKEEADNILNNAKEKSTHIRKALSEDEASASDSTNKMEELIQQKESIFKRRENRNKSLEGNINKMKSDIAELQKTREEVASQRLSKLASASGVTPEKAHEQARTELEALITEGKEAREKVAIEEFTEDIQSHAKAVLQIVIQRLGVQSSVDKNTTSIRLRDDKFKGMLIGKGGSNITYFESLVPVAVIFNLGDPSNIYVGGLNLFRRNIAKTAIKKLEKLAKNKGKLTHEMIKEALVQSEKEIMSECDRKGKWAFKQMGIDWQKTDPEVVNLVGRLYFRTSFGQNIIHHSLEMAYAARLIAELIGTDVEIAMLAAFFHDLGKAIDHDVGGSHDDLSKELLEKFNYDDRIVYAAFAHHDKVPCQAPADFIVKAVDAISGGRPGARMESVTNYFERMKQLEDTAKSFKGVGKVLTMSAGREVRVLVNKDEIKDKSMQVLADEIAEKISEDIAFPGIIKVNLIRQTKSIDYARDRQRR